MARFSHGHLRTVSPSTACFALSSHLPLASCVFTSLLSTCLISTQAFTSLYAIYCKVIPTPISCAARLCYVFSASASDSSVRSRRTVVGGTRAHRWIYYAGHLGKRRVRLHVTVGLVLREGVLCFRGGKKGDTRESTA